MHKKSHAMASYSIYSQTAIVYSYVGAARKVSPDWSQKTMTCHCFNCFSIVLGQC